MTPIAIQSPQNPVMKEIRKAVLRGSLTEDGLAVCETFRLLEDVRRSPAALEVVIVAEEKFAQALDLVAGLEGVRVCSAPAALLQQSGSVEASQGVIGLVRPKVWTVAELLAGDSLVVVLDGMQDPGNAGALLRMAEAFGATGAISVKGTVNLFNPKAIRASAGSVFRLPLLTAVEEEAVIESLQGMACYAAMPGDGAVAVDEVDWTEAAAVIIGSEGHGVRETLRRAAREVTVPTVGVESLNAGAAATVILYEASRQRRRGRL